VPCARPTPLSTSGCRQEVYLTRRATSVVVFTSPVRSPTRILDCMRCSEAELGSESQLEAKVGSYEARSSSVDFVTVCWDAYAGPLLYQCAVDRLRAGSEWGSVWGGGERETEMREGSLTAPLAHWADAGVTEFD